MNVLISVYERLYQYQDAIYAENSFLNMLLPAFCATGNKVYLLSPLSELNQEYETKDLFKINTENIDLLDLPFITSSLDLFKGNSARYYRSFFKYIKRYLNEIDLFFVVSINPIHLLLIQYFRILRKNFVVYVRSFFKDEVNVKLIKQYIKFSKLQELALNLVKFSEKLMLKNTKIIAVSSALADYYSGVSKSVFLARPSLLNPLWFKNPPLRKPYSGTLNFLFVGRLVKEKNLNMLIRTFRKLQANFPEAMVLRIVGDGPEERTLKSSAGENADNVLFLGKVTDQKKLISFYDMSQVFVLPSFTEAYPKVVEEAISRKCLVLVTDKLQGRIKNKVNGLTFNPENDDDLYEQMGFVLNNYSKTLDYVDNMSKQKISTHASFIDDLRSIVYTSGNA